MKRQHLFIKKIPLELEMNSPSKTPIYLPPLNSLDMGFTPGFSCDLVPMNFNHQFIPAPQVEKNFFEFSFDFSSEDSCDFSDCDTFISCSYDF